MIPSLVDSHVGVLNAVAEVRRRPGAPNFFHYAAHLSNTQAFSEYAHSGSRGAAAADRVTAASQVIRDAVAGYCAALISEEDGKHAICSAIDAPFPCVSPAEFALFSPEQYAQPGFVYSPFRDDTPVQWSEAFDPLADESVFIPSCFRFLPYSPLVGHGEAVIAPANSIGLACDWIPSIAATDALCDVIECDTLAIVWQARMSLPQIRVETLSDANYDLVSRFERAGGSVTLLMASLDLGVPVILACLSHSASTAPARIFAAATSLDPEQAVRRSLEMLAHVEQYCQLLWSQSPRPSQDPGHIADQTGHLNYWCDRANADNAAFLFASKERIEFDELENAATNDSMDDLFRLLERIRASGHRALLANLTTPDIEGLQMTVVRAIIPGFQPLHFGFHLRALGGTRLQTIPKKLGRGVPSGENPAPHPFPRKGMVS